MKDKKNTLLKGLMTTLALQPQLFLNIQYSLLFIVTVFYNVYDLINLFLLNQLYLIDKSVLNIVKIVFIGVIFFQACRLPLFEYLAERMCSLCYDRAWYAKLGGCIAVSFLYERMSIRWVYQHLLVFVKAQLFVMMDLTGEVKL